MVLRNAFLLLSALTAMACDGPRDFGDVSSASMDAAGDAAAKVDSVEDAALDATHETGVPDAAKDGVLPVDAAPDVDVPETAEETSAPDDCHYDCFGGQICEGGIVSILVYLPVPCAFWKGACPVEETIACPHGCKFEGASSGRDADPQALCLPCADPKKAGAECDQCADPKWTGSGCDACVDPAKHGPSCDQCLGGPGSAGCPCSSHDECIYKVCLESADGNRCAKGCSANADCPASTACVSLGGGYPSACTPPFGYLCKACKAGSDCALPGHWNTVCADLGKPGQLQCTRLCESDAGCPAGFSCILSSYGGGQAKLCKPQAEEGCG